MTDPDSRLAGATARALGSGVVAVGVSALALARWSHVDEIGFALGWVAFVPWLWLLDRTTSWRGALLGGWAMSVAFALAVFGWFADAVHGYTGAPSWLCLVLLALAAPLLEPQFVACAMVRHAVRWTPRDAATRDAHTTTLAGAAVASAAYVATEWAWPKLLGDTVGYGFWIAPLLRQAADAIGPLGLTFVLLLLNECVLQALRGFAQPGDARSPRGLRAAVAPVVLASSLLALLTLYGAVRIRQLTPSAGAPQVTVAAIQAGHGNHRELAAAHGTYGAVRTILDAHFALSEQALREGAELIVWPETVYPTTFGAPKSDDGAALDREIAGFVATTGVPLLFGAYDASDGREYNAAILLERDGDRPGGGLGFDAYRKARLFPLTERVPALLDRPWVRERLPWLGTWQPGASANVLTFAVPGRGRDVRIAPLICYDAVDAPLVRSAVRAGAQLLVTLSNDAWFASGDGPLQHLVVAGFRSIETRTPQIRATTTGMSAIVTATGETLALAGVGERAALVARVTPAAAPRTLQLLWGDWFPPAVLAASLAWLAATSRRT